MAIPTLETAPTPRSKPGSRNRGSATALYRLWKLWAKAIKSFLQHIIDRSVGALTQEDLKHVPL